MKSLQAAVFLDSLLQIGLVLCGYILDLLVKPFDFQLAHHILLSEFLKGRRILLFLFAYVTTTSPWHDINRANVFLGVAKPLRIRREDLNGALTEVTNLTLQGIKLQRTQILHVLRHKLLISVRLEQILCHLGFLSLLEAPEYEIDPLWQGHADRV